MAREELIGEFIGNSHMEVVGGKGFKISKIKAGLPCVLKEKIFIDLMQSCCELCRIDASVSL